MTGTATVTVTMRRTAARTACAVTMFIALILFAVPSAHATQQMLWLDNQYWQTGQLGAESFAHENPAVSGYLATHVVSNENGVENYKLPNSGQYCSSNGLGPLNKGEGTEWFGVSSAYRQGNGQKSVCAAWEPSSEKVDWGLQLFSKKPEAGAFTCKELTPVERCGIEHYFSLAGQGLNDRPWNSYMSNPELVLDDVYDKLKMEAFQAGTHGAGWGYMCPVLEEAGKEHNIIEVCFEQWRGLGPKNNEAEWGYEHIAECHASSEGFKHSYDKIVVPYNTPTLWNELNNEPQKESAFPLEIWGQGNSLQTKMPAAFMKEMAEFDNKSFKFKTETEGGRNGEPELGFGCARSSSTVPSEWALIGVANGMEEWLTGEEEAGRPNNGLATETLESIDVRTNYGPHEIEIKSENATKATETEATVTGEINPAGYPTHYVIEYGPNSINEHTTPEVSVGSGTTFVPVSTKLTGLTPSTSYKYRIKASFANAGVGYGPEQTFSTTGKPTVATYPASFVSSFGAQLNGGVNPRGSQTKFYFEYGTKEKALEHKTTEVSAGSSTSNLEEAEGLRGLLGGQKYYFRIVAKNAFGTSYGLEDSFTTSVPKWSLQSMPSPSESKEPKLDSISCSSPSACTSVGQYETKTGTIVTLAERWNGEAWLVQSTPNPTGALKSILKGVSCASATECIAVGEYEASSGWLLFAERWNGTEWTVRSVPTPSGGSYLTAVSCSSSSACEAVGRNAKEGIYTLAEVWNGTEWKVQSTPNPAESQSELDSVSCWSSSGCMAAGYAWSKKAGTDVSLAEMWNGKEWKLQPTINPSEAEWTYLDGGISCTSSTACTAVGRYGTKSVHHLGLAERWNGTEWAVQAMPAPVGGEVTYLNDISCGSSTSCTAVGQYDASGISSATLAEQWSGKEWTAQTPPNPTGTEDGFGGVWCSSPAAPCVAVGSNEYENRSYPLAERYE